MTTKLNNKKTILIFIDWFWPGYLAGGPVQSILSLVQYLNTDFEFYIFTSNSDLDGKPYPSILPNTWNENSFGCKVYYANTHQLDYFKIKSILNTIKFDAVYINSFLSLKFSILPLLILKKNYSHIPVVLAPRGMLGDGALSIKPIKKNAFMAFSKLIGLHKNVIWHATSISEKNEICKRISNAAKVYEISNLPKIISISSTKLKDTGVLKICFVSRISIKKNLRFALEVLSQIKNFSIVYSIFGPIEDKEYWESCQQIISNLPSNIKIIYKGTLKPEQIENAFNENNILFLPSLNENFGHAIVESLMCGCPVIISDQTPWNDLQAHNAGFAINLNNKKGFEDAIYYYANMNEEEFSKTSLSAHQYITSKINIQQTVELYKNLFNDCIKN